ncbi:MAG TPA: hypothetical protein VG755_38145 [Nannocystaceae bacterium]|nr:hypothetical protein [Nannocystaceae bacterium]
MNVPRSALVLASIFGCTVGDGGDTTLSGGASAATAATSTAQTDDGSDATSDPIASTDSTSGGVGDGGSSSSGDVDASDADASSGGDGASSSEGGGESSSTDTGDDLADGVLDVTIIAHDDCTITTMPASIAVPEGTEFTVNWISAASSETNVDVAKIDAFNAVPIILGMEPGTSYHDEVRAWCGTLFTGTFDFEITSCFEPQMIPVDCSA